MQKEQKDLPERVGIAETKIDVLEEWRETMEASIKTYRENREKNLMTGMWFCIKLAGITTVLTLTTPKMREGVSKVWEYFSQ